MDQEESTKSPRRQEEEYTREDEEDHRQEEEGDPTTMHGDKMKKKPENICRVISCQMNGYAKTTYTTRDKTKNKQLQDLIQHSGVDILMTQEDNTNWKEMTAENQMKERLGRWAREIRVSLAFNTNQEEARGLHLQGGTSCCGFDKATSRVIKTGVDKTHMGR